eukprot:SAG11_NODE_1385_length_5070_cov_3.950915_5_plen_74_part_00
MRPHLVHHKESIYATTSVCDRATARRNAVAAHVLRQRLKRRGDSKRHMPQRCRRCDQWRHALKQPRYLFLQYD